jgi:hypothetical protein
LVYVQLLVLLGLHADANVQGGMVGDLSFMRPEFIQVFLLLDQGSFNVLWELLFFLLA